jgi:hypothetical protein
MKMYYKVVALSKDNVPHSYGQFPYGDVTYWIGEWVEPPENCGPLTVFETYEQAEYFAWIDRSNTARRARIYECEIKKSRCTKIWMKRKSDTIIKHLEDMGRGTVLAKKVKLVRRVTK